MWSSFHCGGPHYGDMVAPGVRPGPALARLTLAALSTAGTEQCNQRPGPAQPASLRVDARISDEPLDPCGKLSLPIPGVATLSRRPGGGKDWRGQLPVVFASFLRNETRSSRNSFSFLKALHGVMHRELAAAIIAIIKRVCRGKQRTELLTLKCIFNERFPLVSLRSGRGTLMDLYYVFLVNVCNRRQRGWWCAASQ